MCAGGWYTHNIFIAPLYSYATASYSKTVSKEDRDIAVKMFDVEDRQQDDMLWDDERRYRHKDSPWKKKEDVSLFKVNDKDKLRSQISGQLAKVKVMGI